MAIAVAGGALLWRREHEPGALGGLLAYASFVSLASVASVPDGFIRSHHSAHHPDDPRFAMTCAALAMLGTAPGLLPLLNEGRRTGQVKRAAWWSAMLALCTLALSTLPSAFFVWRALMADTP